MATSAGGPNPRRRGLRQRGQTESSSSSAADPPAEPSDDDDAAEADEPSSPERRPPSRLAERLARRRQAAAGNTDDITDTPRAARPQADAQPSFLASAIASVRATVGLAGGQYFLSRYQVASSMPLQMMIFFTGPYACVWAVSNQLLFYWKSRIFEVPLMVAVVSPMIFWVWLLLEPVRLLLGYVGNVRERVAWLGGFWVLTILQLICQVYFLLGQRWLWFNLPVENATSAFFVLFNLLQLVIGYSTIKRLIAKAMADFHLEPIAPEEEALDGQL